MVPVNYDVPLELDSSCPRGWSSGSRFAGKSPPACLAARGQKRPTAWQKVQHAQERGHVAVVWKGIYQLDVICTTISSLQSMLEILANTISNFFVTFITAQAPFPSERRAMNAVSCETHNSCPSQG
jgi:hypothetical protein